ncbi:MAG TPA: BlaI/MecI/CopY family transcriptional regulator [Acidobacteriota bacterium]|nr:BlaI/MecI/CopY family transcriptional regulator [Acidobacteriota bacterium]
MTSKNDIPDLGPLEFTLVRLLWKSGPASARQILERYNARSDKPLAYTTVMTLLTRLSEKGVLDVDRSRQPFQFTARVSREQLLRQRVHDFVDLFFEGQPLELAMRLVEDTRLSQEEIRRLEDMLERHKAEREESDES